MKYIFTDWKKKKKNCLLLFFFFFTMHPSNRDHKDMQKRGVQTFFKRGGGVWGQVFSGGWAHKIKQKRLAGRALVAISILGERTGKVEVGKYHI